MKRKVVLLLSILCSLVTLQASNPLKPRVVILTDIAPANVEPDDMESMVRLLAYADVLEIEALIPSTGWNCDPYPVKWADYLYQVIDAYEKDVPNLMKRSKQKSFQTLSKEKGRQAIGYWPSPAYLRSRVAMGSLRSGIAVVGEGNGSAGSDFIVRLVDEKDPRPLWIAVWGGANTLAQAIWQVKQQRTEEELKEFLHKLRVYTITDQDMPASKRRNHAYSSHQWLREEFADDLLFIWDEEAWRTFCKQGANHWQTYETQIQGKGWLGSVYPKYKYGVEGDTPSFLHILPNGLNDAEKPIQAGWGGCFAWGECMDLKTMAWTNWQKPQKNISRRYEDMFYGAIFNDFVARMEWAATGQGNINPIVVINGKKGVSPVYIKAKSGETVTLDASRSYDPDGGSVAFQWWMQPDAGTYQQELLFTPGASKQLLTIPAEAKGKSMHVICEVHGNGRVPLVSYRRVIIAVED